MVAKTVNRSIIHKYEKLTPNQLIDNTTALAIVYRKRFKKNLGITSEVGEYKASKLLKLKRVEGNINPGYDAIDGKKKVQIKARIFKSNTDRTGNFSKHRFDYALLVLLSPEYEVMEIWKASENKVLGAIKAQSYSKPSLPIGKFMNIGQCVYLK